jgi:signal transduction histidine kinase
MTTPTSDPAGDGRPARFSVTTASLAAVGAVDMHDSRRFTAEARLLGMLGWLWLVGLIHAMTWMWAVRLGPSRADELPWMELAVPQLLALAAVSYSLFRDLPRERWASPPAPPSARTAWIVALGWPTLPFVALAWWRHRRTLAGAAAHPDDIERAWLRLLEIPRSMALRFMAWATIADLIDAVLIGLHLGWATDTVAVMGLLWLAILGPLAAAVHGWAHAILRVEIMGAPRPDAPPFRRTDELRPRLFVNAAAACAGAIAAPLCAGYLWIASLPETEVPSDLLIWGGVVCMAACVVAIALVVADLQRDITRASHQVAVVADGEAPAPLTLSSFSSREIRELVQAVDRLVQRITEANVTKYIAIEKAKEADRLKSQFLANMSHDLRSPLNSIIGFSELLLSGIDGEITDAQRELVEPILRGGRHLLQEIDDILDTAKIEASRLDLHPEPTPPATIVNRAIAAAKKRNPSVSFDTEAAAGVPPVFVDPTRVVQAVESVLLFAAERVETASVQISIRTGNAGGQRVVMLQVRTPVRPATADQLAQARRGFFRIPGHRGLGLGLPLAGAILELSGGSLSIEDLGDGMIFALSLPAPHARRGRPTPIPRRPAPTPRRPTPA